MDTENKELMEALSGMLVQALKASIGPAIEQVSAGLRSSSADGVAPHPKPPTFSMPEYRSSEGATVEDYFNRFEWALQLSKIPEPQYADFARVHMGAELNSSLKFLIAPKQPQEATYTELRKILQAHWDEKKNKFVQSVKFRTIVQQRGESIAQYVLKLKQGSAYCEYGEFLDRMLIEQMLHGLTDRDICDEIIAKNPSTFQDALDVALALEATHKIARDINTSAPETTNKLGYERPMVKRSQTRRNITNKTNDNAPKNRAYGKIDSNQPVDCNGCGGGHLRSECRFRNAKCNLCSKKGHIAKVCKSGKSKRNVPESDQKSPMSLDHVQWLNRINNLPSGDKKMIDVKIDGKTLKMELDTGAPCGIVSESTLRAIKPHFVLQPSDKQFSSYTGHRVTCIGRIKVHVTIGSVTHQEQLYVVSGAHDSLLGRDWISHFAEEIDLNRLFSARTPVHTVDNSPLSPDRETQLSTLLDSFANVFSEFPGKLIGPPAKVHLRENATPVFAKARDVPLALRDRYAAEIDSKIKSGFYEKVDYSEWASPTHVVVKKNGKLRIRGNYKPTVNPMMIIDEHPIPRIESIFNRMKGATLFCHLDVTDAYTHLPIDMQFREVLTLNTTTHGLIRPTRAVYGAANIPTIWQRRMEEILLGLPNVVSFYDDIIVFAKDYQELLLALTSILSRIREHGLKLNRSKCVFATTSLECLGHRIDQEGLHKGTKHIEAIRDAPRPCTREELQLFLGKATYYSQYIPNLSTRANVLRNLLATDRIKWSTEADEAYRDIKNALISPQVLTQYDPALPLILATDASKTGLGAVLSHKMNNGLERPIAYASCTMSATEQRYPVIDKEALAIVWAVKKFFNYLYARKFTLVTDHKPLTQILHPEKSLPTLCISRMANYADYLAHFNFEVVYRSTNDNKNADYCSRIPSSEKRSDVNKLALFGGGNDGEDEFEGFVLHQIQQLPIRAEQIARETRKDDHLGKILKDLEMGRDLSNAGYKAPESKYNLVANCLLFELRFVIPCIFRPSILKDLHSAHIGMVKMKALARSYVYWPGIDTDIEKLAKACGECAQTASSPPKYNQHHWEYPSNPWDRVHVDYAGPVAGAMLLVVVDAHSKWTEVRVTHSTTTAATIAILDDLFASYGAPVTVVTDNGPQFVSEEFKTFLQRSGVKWHKTSAPYHPATNGQAERYVQTVKKALKAMNTTSTTLSSNLNEFLQQYRKVPHSETGEPPAKLFLGRNIRSRLDLIRPQDIHTKFTEKQRAESKSAFRTFFAGQRVFFLSGNPRKDKWLLGTVISRLGDLQSS
ncbi:uncharacterized protein K02A2.6-like [Anopheles funestus]|uniref:uncharacterized protein K02A2.6-like n=1 Tax=Anopheles funestus TaxID=62324 RepID=UPI0020C68012|nr:uncharacterized protein K02A2.6-like [Anopheles funestus]